MTYFTLNENNLIIGVYTKGINKIPEGAILVSDEIKIQRLNDSSLNCYENGKLIKKDFRTDKEIIEQEKAQFRATRIQLLIEADIEINKREDNGIDASAWRVYRQSLRDATLTWEFPSKPIERGSNA